MNKFSLVLRLMVISIAMIAAVSVFDSESASAKGKGGGAVVTHENIDIVDDCSTNSYWNWYWWVIDDACETSSGVMHKVETPSGNTNYIWSNEGTTTFQRTWCWYYCGGGWDWVEINNQEFTESHNEHIKKGEPHVFSWTETRVTTSGYIATPPTSGWTPSQSVCTTEIEYHYANGNVTKDINSVVCVPA